jgi:hypothetical protein
MLEVNMSQNIECDNSICSEMFMGMMIVRNLMHMCEPFIRLYLSSRRGSACLEVARRLEEMLEEPRIVEEMVRQSMILRMI